MILVSRRLMDMKKSWSWEESRGLDEMILRLKSCNTKKLQLSFIGIQSLTSVKVNTLNFERYLITSIIYLISIYHWK